MKNKNQRFKLGLLMFAILGFSLGVSSAVTFKLNVQALSQKALAENIMYVHFADNGNDFGGFVYFSNGSGNDDTSTNSELYSVGTSDDSNYECRVKVRGFYYNAERGERLWPLSSGDLAMPGLVTTGGIYTTCAVSGYNDALKKCEQGNVSGYNSCVNEAKRNFPADGYGYYGQLIHIYSGYTGVLTVGVEYNTNTKFISIKSGSKLSPTFVRINNKYPVGFIYDYNGGLGLAGCRFGSGYLAGGSMKNLVRETSTGLLNVFRVNSAGTGIEYSGSLQGISCDAISTEDTLVKIIIEGIVGMDDSGKDGDTKFGGLGNSSDTKMQYFGTKSVSNNELMNYVAKKAELLCRGKWTNDGDVFNINKDKIICWDGGDIGYGSGNLAKKGGRTLIVKNADVRINPFSTGDNKYHDIYILSGNLIIVETIGPSKKSVFTTGGFRSSTSVSSFSGAVHANSGNYSSGDAVVGSFIRGNFVVNGNVIGSGNVPLKNKYFIYGKFTTKDSITDLENVFGWRCNNGEGSDGNYCPRFEGNPYRNAALVVIDQNYGSPMLQS